MADMHIIAGDGQGNWHVVMHFDVPDVNNAVSVNYRTALKNSDLTSVSVLPDGDGTGGSIDAAEKTALANGVKFEHVLNVTLDGPGVSNTSRIALLKKRYAATKSEVLDRLQARLKFFGFNQARI